MKMTPLHKAQMSADLFIMGDMHHGDEAKIYWVCDQNVMHIRIGVAVIGYQGTGIREQ